MLLFKLSVEIKLCIAERACLGVYVAALLILLELLVGDQVKKFVDWLTNEADILIFSMKFFLVLLAFSGQEGSQVM